MYRDLKHEDRDLIVTFKSGNMAQVTSTFDKHLINVKGLGACTHISKSLRTNRISNRRLNIKE